MSQAQEELQRAVEAAIAEHRGDDDGMVVDWALVVQTTSFIGDRQASGYYLIYSGGQMPEHRAIGLFRYGEHLVAAGPQTREE